MDEFFDHYLLGKPRPAWMDKGVSYLDRGKRDVAPLFKKKAVTSTATARRAVMKRPRAGARGPRVDPGAAAAQLRKPAPR